MHSPTQSLMHKIPLLYYNAGSILANHKQYLFSNTPLIQELLVDSPQFMTHTAPLVTLKLDILQDPDT